MKKAFLTSLFVFALAVISPRLAVADDGLTLTGTLANSGTECFKGSNDLFIYLTVSFQARNDLNRKLFFAKPDTLFDIEIFDWRGVSDMIEKAPSIRPLQRSIFSGIPSKTLSDRESGSRIQSRERRLHTLSFPYRNAPPPPFLTLDPGGYHEFSDTFYLSPQPENATLKSKLGEICKEPDPSKRIMPTLKDLGFADGKFKVRYSFSARDHKEYSTALSDLQERLEPFGHLPLSPAGDIVYTSDHIILAP